MALVHAGQAVELARDAPPIVLADALMCLISAALEAGRPTAETDRLCTRLEEVSLHVESGSRPRRHLLGAGHGRVQVGQCRQGLELHELAMELLSPRRDLRLWLRLNRSAAKCRLDAGITDGRPGDAGRRPQRAQPDRQRLRHVRVAPRRGEAGPARGPTRRGARTGQGTAGRSSHAPGGGQQRRGEELLAEIELDLGRSSPRVRRSSAPPGCTASRSSTARRASAGSVRPTSRPWHVQHVDSVEHRELTALSSDGD